ncbi:hypothetical protein [Polyangium mundeleinium]|uniref:Tetratricopeptide repeat protein n=1 Tax=Polyangium mundeleinium TaxID=2995306 RepID=A0ABT5EHI0_9BACT|nr:hypothetical protein [Polyangium mundeleinium]MDC0740200.1 hypothetical protein [Polyangium mundeleinium]
MSELGPEARAILLAGRDGDDPSPADRARLRRALAAAIAAGGASVGGEGVADAATTKLGEVASATKIASAAKTSAVFSLGGLAWKGMLALIVGGAASAVAILGPTKAHVETPPAATHLEAPAPLGQTPPAQRPAEVEVQPLEALPTDEPPPPPVPAHQNTPAVNAPFKRPAAPIATNEPPPAPVVDPLLAETKRLRAVHGAMKEGDPEQALRLLDETSAGAEGQSLRAERTAARVLALCKLGRVAEARAEAARFLSESPGSPLADRVRKACPASP